MKRVAVTGAAGQISYSLLFRLASGDLFGPNEPISLSLLELPVAFDALKGIVMELEDCAFPLLKEVRVGTDPNEMFEGAEYIFLVGAKPRGPGMERKDLLHENASIFVTQGASIDRVASKKAKILVVGNPCNTNCLIALQQAKLMPKENFFAMTRLDQNRFHTLLARKAGVSLEEVSKVTIWGNHSTSQVPDLYHTFVKGKPAINVVGAEDFIKEIQERGATVIKARGKSSAASAAKAAIDAMRAVIFPTEWHSTALLSDHNPYGIESGLVYSFPCRTTGDGKVEIIKGLDINETLRQKLKASEKELLEERVLIGPYSI